MEKTRKQLSPESLEKLALAREKALQTRLKNKAIREQVLEQPEPEPEKETEPEPKTEPIPDKIEPKKIQPDSEDEDKEVAKPKKVKKKSNRSKIVISNDSSSSDSEDDTPVVYIRTKKKTKPKIKPTVVEHEEVVQDLQPQYQEPPEIVRQVPLEPVYERPVIRRPDWW